MCYSSLALVIYEPIRNLVVGEEGKEASFLQRLVAGGTAGAVAITVFNPTEVSSAEVSSAEVSSAEVSSAEVTRSEHSPLTT